ncbi:MAG: AMP-binding protein, partial [Opitutus sp.]
MRTGGSGGGVKFARHDECTLSAAVAGWCAHFYPGPLNAVDVLPAHHVSGLMARLRCAVTGGRHLAWDWKRLESGDHPVLCGNGAAWTISLVPTQLQRLLRSTAAVDWLRRFGIVFVGGGPSWPELANQAAEEKIRVSLSYGTTETAAMVAALRPDEFLAGARSSGTALPHARIRIAADGVIAVAGESISRGYAQSGPGGTEPGDFHVMRENAADAGGAGREFVTEDLGRIDERGHLHVVGRRDAMIITGGRKVQPAAVEAALRSSGEFDDVAV